MENSGLKNGDFFYSYNCFNSCLGTLLKDYYEWGINLAVHSNWNFFYSKTWYYDHDNRFMGEYPHPYNLNTLDRVKDILGLHIKICDKKLETINDLLYLIDNNHKFLIFVNKFFFDKNEGKEKVDNYLATAIVDDYNRKEKKVHYYLGEDDFSSHGWIDVNKFILACKYAPHNYKINGMLFYVGMKDLRYENKTIIKRENMVRTAISYIISTANEFIVGANEGNTSFGADAIRLFAEDILTWSEHPMIYRKGDNKLIFKRMTDCAIYLEFARKQRELFSTALSEISETLPQISLHICKWKQQIEDISRKWTYFKFMLYLASTRKQVGALNSISHEIITIRKMEINFLESICEEMKALY